MRKLLLGLAGLGLIAVSIRAVEIKGPMPAEEGETCVVCNNACSRDDVAYLVDGQRMAIMKPMEQEFLSNPEEYVRAYKPNTMQFSGGPAQGMSDSYLLFGLLALVGIGIAGFIAHQTILKRSNPAMVPAGLGKIPNTKLPVACAACGGENHPSAAKCSLCGASMPTE